MEDEAFNKRIYPAPKRRFEEKLREKFGKKVPFTQSKAREVTGSHPEQIKKWISEMVEERKLRPVTAYLFGCPQDKLLIANLGRLGVVAICIECNSEAPWPPEDPNVLVCPDCDAVYVRDGVKSFTCEVCQTVVLVPQAALRAICPRCGSLYEWVFEK